MASIVNPYFSADKTTEQSLFEGLKIETIQMRGREYFYLPRNLQKEDLVLGESVLSKFTLAIPIEAYMVDVMGFQGDREMFSKFGLSIKNSYTLVISQKRWEDEVKILFDGNSGNGEANFSLKTKERPQEGDLIYDPLTDYLMEIKFVDHDLEFYELGKNYLFNLSCEAFMYQSEKIATGIPAIDAFDLNSMDALDFQLVSEAGENLKQQDCDFVLQEEDPDPERKYGTDFEGQAVEADVGVVVKDPFDL